MINSFFVQLREKCKSYKGIQAMDCYANTIAMPLPALYSP